MARPSSDYAAVHAEADRFEPRLSRAVQRSMTKLQERVSINALALALSAGDVKSAVSILSPGVVEDALSPAGTIVRDAVIRGGRIGAQQLNKARGL